MRIISIRDDVEQVALQYVRALPDVFTQYDINFVELVEYLETGSAQDVVFAADIVFVEDDDYEIVIGDVQVGTDLMLEVDIYSEEDELKLTSEQII